MKQRTVEMVASPREPHWVGDGFRVHNFVPNEFRLSMKRTDPFIMLDYASKHIFQPALKPKGVGVHPHRGFETVTLAYKGRVEHHDSSGGGGIIDEGDVQWMTAASGVLHKEYHETEWSKKGGEFQMVQLWVNLPAKDKMSTPKYQAISNKDINRYVIENNGGEIEVIAGKYKDVDGSASTFTPLNMYNAKLNSGTQIELDFPSNFNTLILVIEGSIVINDTENVPTNHLALMANDGDSFNVKASENSVVLVLSGEPINEPIATHGPFVMNTQEEIAQAFVDFNQGKFGYLAD